MRSTGTAIQVQRARWTGIKIGADEKGRTIVAFGFSRKSSLVHCRKTAEACGSSFHIQRRLISPMNQRPLVAVCGKFQPFHNEHLAYVRAAFDVGARVIVGITNPDESMIRPESADPKRSLPESNPYTYYERYTMIDRSLAEIGIDRTRYDIVPFPINRMELLKSYVPREAVILVTLYDDDPWLVERRAKMEAAGWTTEVLWHRPGKAMTASVVRDAMRAGQEWTHLVPPAVRTVIQARRE